MGQNFLKRLLWTSLFTASASMIGCNGFHAVTPAKVMDLSSSQGLAAQIRATGAFLTVSSPAQTVLAGACSSVVTIRLFKSDGSPDVFSGSIGVPISASSSN